MSRAYRAPRRLSRRSHRRGGRRNRAAADTAILCAAPQAGRLRPQVTAVSSEHPAGLLPTAPPLPHPRSSQSRPPPPPDLGWGLVPLRTAPSRPPLELRSVSCYLLAEPVLAPGASASSFLPTIPPLLRLERERTLTFLRCPHSGSPLSSFQYPGCKAFPGLSRRGARFGLLCSGLHFQLSLFCLFKVHFASKVPCLFPDVPSS